MYITQLRAGQTLQCWSRLGLALTQEYIPSTKEVVYVAPTKPQQAGPSDLTWFGALVLSNDTNVKCLTLQAYALCSGKGTPSDPVGKHTYLHYSYFARMRLISPISYEGRPLNPRRPTLQDALGQLNYKAYRTATEVILKW